ncbi:MAG TPA: hypothetical protein VF868_10190 [Bacteroidia bacterium]|jgi:hypothetical protein
MKIYSGLFISLLCMLSVSSFTADNCKVNYNGIYAIKLDEEHSAVLRFYEDGTVLASTSVNDYMDVMSWFNKENKDMVLKGNYKIKKCDIKFKVSGMNGEQSYEGAISDDRISFQVMNKDSKKSISRTYTFFAL